jgi:hypothetical protein
LPEQLAQRGRPGRLELQVPQAPPDLPARRELLGPLDRPERRALPERLARLAQPGRLERREPAQSFRSLPASLSFSLPC